MKRFASRLGALVLCLCLWTCAAFAGVPGLDGALSDYLDFNQDVSMSLGFAVKSLPPFAGDTLGMINGALKHIAVNARLSGGDTALAFAADGAGLFSLTETYKDGAYELTSSLLPNRLLRAGSGALEALYPSEEEGEEAFDLSQAVAQAEECYQALTDGISPYAEEKKANYKIADIGYAKWVRLARLTQEQSAALLAPMIALLGCGMDAAFREQIQTLTCKNGFTVALYQDKQGGTDLAVYMKGNVSLGEGDSHTLVYQWAFLRQDGKRKDTYKLEWKRAQKPVEQRVIEVSSFNVNEGGKLTSSGKGSVTLKNGADTVITTTKRSLKGKEGQETVTLSGTLSSTVKTTKDGQTETVTTELTPDLTMTSAQGSGVLSGSVDYTETVGKATGLALTVTLDPNPAQALLDAAASGQLYAVADEPAEAEDAVTITIGGRSLTQNQDAVEKLTSNEPSDYLVGQAPTGLTAYTPPASLQTVNLDGVAAEELDALRQEMAQNAAGPLLKALVGLEGEDGALFRDNITDGDFASFLTTLSNLN